MRGAILIGIVLVTVLQLLLRRQYLPRRLLAAAVDRADAVRSSTSRARCSAGILNVVLVFFLVELFDATGTLMGVAAAPACWSRARWSA